MIKKILLILLLIGLFNNIYAQNIKAEYQKSEIFRDKYKYSNIVSINQDSQGGVVIVRIHFGGIVLKPKGYFIEHYNNKLELINEYNYPIENKIIAGVFITNDILNIIETHYDENKKGYIYTASSAPLKTLQFITKELLFIEAQENEVTFLKNTNGRINSNYFSQLVFDDAQENLIITTFQEKRKNNYYKIIWFDQNLNKKLDYEFIDAFKNKDFIIENLTASPIEETIYVSGKTHFERKKRNEGVMGRYQYELFKINSKETARQIFDFADHQITSLKPVFINNQLIAVGFYSKSGRGLNRYSGLEFFELEPSSLSIIKQKLNPFSEQFMIDKYGVDKDKEVENLIFRNLHITQNNEIIFNAEEYFYTRNYQTNNSGSGMWVERHHYNDIVCAKINAQGNLEWARNINKKEVTTGDEAYVSYTSFTQNNNSLFFINSGEQPRKISKERLLFNESFTRTPDVFIVQIDQNGIIDYKKIIEENDTAAPIMVSKGLICPQEQEVYFLARRGNRKQLFKVTL